jgi:hypothetical protein
LALLLIAFSGVTPSHRHSPSSLSSWQFRASRRSIGSLRSSSAGWRLI